MASPLAIGSIGATAAGGILGAFGSAAKGSSEAAMYNYQAGVAQTNAAIAKQDANYALAAGEVEGEQSGMRTRAEIGATRAGFGASNVSGASSNRVLASESEIGAENAGIIRANAAKRAYGFEVGAAQDVAQAGAYKTAATTSVEAGDIGAISSIVGGAGQVASKWLQYGQAFPSNSGTQGGMGLYDGAQTGSLY